MTLGRQAAAAGTIRAAATRTAESRRAWLRALELTAPIATTPQRILPTVIDELAARLDAAPALLSERECLSYRALAERVNRYAHWALERGIGIGDTVALFMPNRPEYLAAWLGITAALRAAAVADGTEARTGRPSRLAGAFDRLIGR